MKYYIYYVVYKDVVIYIGKGKDKRYLHTTSGTSHVYELNRLHFTEPGSCKVDIAIRLDEDKDVSYLEKLLIKQCRPYCNNALLENSDIRFQTTEEEFNKLVALNYERM